MSIVLHPQAVVPPALPMQAAVLQQQAWPGPGSAEGPVHDPALAPRTMLLLEGGRVRASLDLLRTEVGMRARSGACTG